MSEAVRARRREFGAGPRSRAAALVYALLVVELLFLVTTAPGLVLLVLLDRHPSNIPLAAACALPLKGEHMLNDPLSPSGPTRGHRVRELVYAYRPLRARDGREPGTAARERALPARCVRSPATA